MIRDLAVLQATTEELHEHLELHTEVPLLLMKNLLEKVEEFYRRIEPFCESKKF